MAIVISLSNTHDKSRIILLIRGQLTDLHLMNNHYFQYINGHQKAEYLWFFFCFWFFKTYFISTFNIMELGSRYTYISLLQNVSMFLKIWKCKQCYKNMKLYVNARVSISSIKEISFTRKLEPIGTERSWMSWPTVGQ